MSHAVSARISKDIMTATAMPAGGTLSPESLDMLADAVGVAVTEVDGAG